MGFDLKRVLDYQTTVEVPRGWAPPAILPPTWALVEKARDGAKYINALLNLAAVISAEVIDSVDWVHLSVSHRHRLPTWRELRECKELFLGDREAYQVLPPAARYVNIKPNVLHLFARCDGAAVLPDFTHGSGSL